MHWSNLAFKVDSGAGGCEPLQPWIGEISRCRFHQCWWAWTKILGFDQVAWFYWFNRISFKHKGSHQKDCKWWASSHRLFDRLDHKLGCNTPPGMPIQLLLVQLDGLPVANSKHWPDIQSAFTDPKSFIDLVAKVEGVGTSAYLAGIPALVNHQLIAGLGAVLTSEVRHNTILRSIPNLFVFFYYQILTSLRFLNRTLDGQDSNPNPFGTPLGPRAVASLAAGFFTSCPAGSDLGLQTFPGLTVNQVNPEIGSTITVSTTATLPTDVFCGFASWVTVFLVIRNLRLVLIFCMYSHSGLSLGFSPLSVGACVIPGNIGGGQVSLSKCPHF